MKITTYGFFVVILMFLSTVISKTIFRSLPDISWGATFYILFIGCLICALLKLYWFYVEKPSKNEEWIKKWNNLCLDLWLKFQDKPISEKTLRWMERNHKRLIKLSEKKFKLKED
jgi:hypothetical protein